MSFKNIFRKSKTNVELNGSSNLSEKERKALLELKAIQAQQNPEPLYDLSSCYTSYLPSDTFTFCKLLGKTKLDIKHNALSSVDSGGNFQDLCGLKVMIASHNKIEKLPNNFTHLQMLNTLDLSFNKLKYLPDSFRNLKSLEELYLTDNKFTKVPLAICALPNLQVLSLNNNDINKIPDGMATLHQTLRIFHFDYDKIENIPSNYIMRGLEGVMDYVCCKNGLIYNGPSASPDGSQEERGIASKEVVDSSLGDDIMMQYMRKKQEQLKTQILEEERLRSLERKQLENVLHVTSKSKEGLLQEISDENVHIINYEEKKKEKMLSQLEIERKMRNEQIDELDVYLTNSNNKDNMLLNLAAEKENLHQEVEAIVSAKETERIRLIQDLSKVEQNTSLALQELLNIQQSQKSSDYISLLKEQEDQLQTILSSVVETSTELRRVDVLQAMQNALMEEAAVASKRDLIESEKKSWLTTLSENGKLDEAHIENIINNKVGNQESFMSSVLQEEQYQSEAFKLLLLKMDLKRNNVIRQIALVEHELTRLSSLELRKKRFGVQYGSTTMLDQRKTLVGLLKSLLKAKKERDEELESWVCELSHRNHSDMTAEDFWLLQYQKLMLMKPASITEAEEHLDGKVYEVLQLANAIDLIPLFAKNNITFDILLSMCEEDCADIGIGSATYHVIQRALHSYLSTSKLGPQELSAPHEEDTASAPKLEEMEAEDISVQPLPLEDRASAPQLQAEFFETECVICLGSDCHVLFFPCGHVCVCANCCQSLINCPLCRSEISNKFYIGQ